MARPKKEADARKSRRITIRLTETEYEVYKEFARRGGFTLSELIRLMMVNGKVSYQLSDADCGRNAAAERIDLITRQLAGKRGIAEKIKADNQLLWVQEVNAIRASAEETVLSELIYAF